jgi:hypothetical protein
MRFFGSDEDYSLGTIIGWLESQIENEAEKPEGTPHNAARLDAAYDALALLNRVDEWRPRDTRDWQATAKARAAIGKAKGK